MTKIIAPTNPPIKAIPKILNQYNILRPEDYHS